MEVCASSNRTLRVGFRCRSSLAGFNVDLGVSKLLGSLDLEASVFVGDDLGGVDRLMHRFHPRWALRLEGVLWGTLR